MRIGRQDGNRKVIVVVFHGSNRNAKNYRSGWVGPAEDNNLLIICPEFTQAKYPGIRYYNTGNIMDRMSGNGILQPQSRWVFPAIDRIINDIKTWFIDMRSLEEERMPV